MFILGLFLHFSEEAKKEDVQKAVKKEDLKSDMKTKLKNLAMKSKQAKDYKRQNCKRHLDVIVTFTLDFI